MLCGHALVTGGEVSLWRGRNSGQVQGAATPESASNSDQIVSGSFSILGLERDFSEDSVDEIHRFRFNETFLE